MTGRMHSHIYHERQVAQMCALHALNNLYQCPEMYTKEEMDQYCYDLTPRYWLNPHRSWLGWGNYDVNVLMYAVKQRRCEAIWFDKRRDPYCLNLDGIFGYILNISSPINIANIIPLPVVRSRHWVALRCIGGYYYNLDSKLPHPELIGNGSEEHFLGFLRHILPNTNHELFIIMMTEQSNYPLWLKPEYQHQASE